MVGASVEDGPDIQALEEGYQNTSTLEILKDCLHYLRTPRKSYPGDGEQVVTLLKDIQEYANRTGSRGEMVNASVPFFQIVNILLEREASIINQDKVIELQEIFKVEALLWGAALISPTSEHLELSSLLVDVYLMDSTLVNDLHFPTTTVSYPAWFMDKISIHLQGSNPELFGNRTFSVAVVAYRNLSRLLPMRYVAKLSDGNELEYEINSRLITVEFNHDAQRISPTPGAFWVEIEFDHSVKDYGPSAWNVTCGVTQTASFTHTWNFDTCRTRNVGPNVTVCGCAQPGTYAVFLTTNSRPPLPVAPAGFNMVVVVGCACCLVQTILTLLLLLPYWWHHRNCLIFLKLQCCTATSGAMGVFIYAVRDTMPKSSYPYVTTSLEAFLLIGMSSHLSKLLIVYTEVVQIPRIKHLRQTVVCIITVVPVLAVLLNHLAHDSTGWGLQSWWLVFGTMLFNIFATSAAVMLLLFVFLYFSVMRRLRLLTGKQEEMNRAIGRRVGLLRRAGFIYCVMVVMVASSIVYINVQDSTYHYIFSVSSALMGFTIFLCYILKSEAPLHIQVLRKLKLDNTPDTDFSSDSANSPLRFFTKQEGETESDAAPPRSEAVTTATIRRCREVRVNPVGHSDLEEGEGTALFGDRAPSTVETYVPVTESSAEEVAATLFQGDKTSLVGAEDVDLEDYNNSPRKYTQMRCRNPQMYSEYVEQEIGPPRTDQTLLAPGDQWQFVRGYYQNSGVIADTTSGAVVKPETPLATSDVVTTRVCVELGVITSRPVYDEDLALTVDTPAIVLCSVDVEPFHHTVLELSDGNTAVDSSARSSSSGVSSTGTQEDGVTLVEAPAIENGDDDKERRQPEGRPDGVNMDGMMDRISHDLDYLLNRKQTGTKSDNTLAAPSFARKTSKPPSSSVRCQIQEEEEDEGMGLSESFTSNSSL